MKQIQIFGDLSSFDADDNESTIYRAVDRKLQSDIIETTE